MSAANSQAPGQWVLGKYEVDGFPVVIKVVDELPDAEIREKYPWLTVITWRYDGSERNGMPTHDVNEQMVSLEHAIDELEERRLCIQVYSRTGNAIKELVYYIEDRDQFMKGFNEVLSDHPRYPLEINFYEDEAWEDLKTVQEDYLGRE